MVILRCYRGTKDTGREVGKRSRLRLHYSSSFKQNNKYHILEILISSEFNSILGTYRIYTSSISTRTEDRCFEGSTHVVSQVALDIDSLGVSWNVDPQRHQPKPSTHSAQLGRQFKRNGIASADGICDVTLRFDVRDADRNVVWETSERLMRGLVQLIGR